MDDKSKIDTFDKIVLGVSIACLIYAGWLYFYNDEMLQVNKRSIVPIQGDDTHFVVNYFFNSTVYSAQNTIRVSLLAWPLEDFFAKHQHEIDQIDTMYVYFSDASTGRETITENGIFYPILGMKKGDDGRFRGGPFEIRYQAEGYKCVLFSLEKLQSTIDTCTEENSVLTVSSADSFLQLENNKTVLALTWIFIAFGIVATRDPLRNIFRRYFSEK